MTAAMEIEGFLADSVEHVGGKLYALGAGWNVIHTPMLPARHPRIGIGLIFHVPYTATNLAHKFILRLEDADGQVVPLGDAPAGVETGDGKVRQLGGQFNVGRPPILNPGDEQLVAIALNVDGLVFEQSGSYRFVVTLDGSDEKNIGFRVSQIPQAGPIVS